MANQLSCCRFIDNSLVVCPAPSFLLDKPAGKGWLAVGDAASAYDPISSQGIHKALSDGLEAANAIAPWLDGGADKLAEYGSSVANRFDVYLKMAILVIHFTLVMNQAILGLALLAAKTESVERRFSKTSGGVH